MCYFNSFVNEDRIEHLKDLKVEINHEYDDVKRLKLINEFNNILETLKMK